MLHILHKTHYNANFSFSILHRVSRDGCDGFRVFINPFYIYFYFFLIVFYNINPSHLIFGLAMRFIEISTRHKPVTKTYKSRFCHIDGTICLLGETKSDYTCTGAIRLPLGAGTFSAAGTAPCASPVVKYRSTLSAFIKILRPALMDTTEPFATISRTKCCGRLNLSAVSTGDNIKGGL